MSGLAFKAVVFDWAGTLIDHGSRAPMGVFVEAFARFDIPVTIDEARTPMGAAKRDHIKAMLTAPRIAGLWEKTHGSPPGEADIDALYAVFLPMNEAVAADHATLIPGAKQTVDALRADGLKIGSTTGYTRSIMAKVLPVVERQGLTVDALVCAGDVAEGRPAPLGMYKIFAELGVYPPHQVVKVDDTDVGIGEGVAAGTVTVGVTRSGNYVGKTEDELAAMPAEEVDALIAAAADRLRHAGADHIIDTVADLPRLLADLS
ncbi:MAG: phosphonoacetaldehyde hydrolase [Pseudomonadota bacterium]